MEVVIGVDNISVMIAHAGILSILAANIHPEVVLLLEHMSHIIILFLRCLMPHFNVLKKAQI